MALATTEKILFAKKLINETQLPISQIAFASGFGSIRRFNAAFQKIYGKTPSAFRHPTNSDGIGGKALFRCKLALSYRLPFDWQGMLGFFQFPGRGLWGDIFACEGIYRKLHQTADPDSRHRGLDGPAYRHAGVGRT